MDGTNRFFLLLWIFFFQIGTASASKPHACNYSCPNAKNPSKGLDDFLNQRKSCALPDSKEKEERNAAKGAAFLSPFEVSNNEQFVSESFRAQGLRVYAADPTSVNIIPKSFQIKNMKKFGKGEGDCFTHVPVDSELKSGDVIVLGQQAIILDQVPTDPFNIREKLEHFKMPPMLSDFSGENLVKAASSICNDWMADASAYKIITAFHEVFDEGKMKVKSDALVPVVFGEETSPSSGISLLIEHAKSECTIQLAEFMQKPGSLAPELSSTAGHFQVLRHQSDRPECRVACTQCCDHVESGAAK